MVQKELSTRGQASIGQEPQPAMTEPAASIEPYLRLLKSSDAVSTEIVMAVQGSRSAKEAPEVVGVKDRVPGCRERVHGASGKSRAHKPAASLLRCIVPQDNYFYCLFFSHFYSTFIFVLYFIKTPLHSYG